MTEREIFEAASEIEDVVQRNAYLDEACGDDDSLRQRVEALLRFHEEQNSFLGEPLVQPTTDWNRASRERIGGRVGPYELLEKLGEGGMGIVYLAEQQEPVKRHVALKVIKPGMDTRQVIARFEAERQALAMMDHPNIAKVLDAGETDGGRPYFVMELVSGVSVTEYCDHRRLSTEERLKLFIPICEAVQHAHQKGIIHRDLKPSNIRVAQYGDQAIPKVIDFGIAKATDQRRTEQTLFTQYGQILGTPEYMSPEQAAINPVDIDTRVDIYSLGVVLYELLTGNTPFDRRRLRSGGYDEMLHIIREEEPLRPSIKLSSSANLPSVAASRGTEPRRLNSHICGELDWIVMKAIEKKRTKRYATARELSDDIKRFLANEAVLARPPSARYRLQELFSKHRRRIITTVGILGLLIPGLHFMSWLYDDAYARAKRDTEHFARTRPIIPCIYENDPSSLVQLRESLQNQLFEIKSSNWLQFESEKWKRFCDHQAADSMNERQLRESYEHFRESLIGDEDLLQLNDAVRVAMLPIESRGILAHLQHRPEQGSQKQIFVIPVGSKNIALAKLVTIQDVRLSRVKDELLRNLRDEIRAQSDSIDNAKAVSEHIFEWMHAQLPNTLMLNEELTNQVHERYISDKLVRP